jgi:hypothetical protein
VGDVVKTRVQRWPCFVCGGTPAPGLEPPDGPDPCLGWLPGVTHACCGHGGARTAYVAFAGGGYATGAGALDYFGSVGVGPSRPLYAATQSAQDGSPGSPRTSRGEAELMLFAERRRSTIVSSDDASVTSWRGVRWARIERGRCLLHESKVEPFTGICHACHREQLEAARRGSREWEVSVS